MIASWICLDFKDKTLFSSIISMLTVQYIHKSKKMTSQLLPNVRVDIRSMVIKGLLPHELGDYLCFSHYHRHFQLLQGVL